MKKQLVLIGIFFIFLLAFISCKNELEVENGVFVSNINGLVEKGPFIAGSSVFVYELDKELKGTGRVFEAKTNTEGEFSISSTTPFVSNYIKLSVNGFYFNEYTGRLSDAQVTLEAITSIDNADIANINVNILTHLEMPRVLGLVSSGMSFHDAKKQAGKELLSAFLIIDQTIVPEKASIIANNTSANILIAISSILLNERTDAEFSEFMSRIREDLLDGEISDGTKAEISNSSFELDCSRIKKNIEERYKELGKNIEIGDFWMFIDGDQDGEIDDDYIVQPPLIDPITPDDLFSTEENMKKAMAIVVGSLYTFIQHQYLFDAVYANTVEPSQLNIFSALTQVYNHAVNPTTSIVRDIWNSVYKAVDFDNHIIYTSETKTNEWIKKYQYYVKTYRAYKYLNAVELWGDVPFVVKPILSSDAINISRTSQHEILSFIISDMEESYQHLPESSSQTECSNYFAKAIQARAYLLLKDYNNALQCVKIIMDSEKFTLSNDVNLIYEGENKEIIYELPNSEDSQNRAYREIIQKGKNIAVCRYAEILLIASEANLKLGNKQEALVSLNQVRTRNGRLPLDLSANIEDALLTEWKQDLGNEGRYFSALKRLGVATQKLNIPEYKLLLPIPHNEIILNPQIIQNQGY